MSPAGEARGELSEARIGLVVEAFYAKVRRDPLLGPVFDRAIVEEAWPEHLAIIRDFWSTVMLRSGRYSRNPFSAHRRVPGIRPELFERWLSLWRETCLEVAPEAAEALYAKAVAIAQSLQAGLFFRPGAPESAPSGR